jgi:hypothetical protein
MKFFFPILFIFNITALTGQIKMENSSFEGEAQDATTPVGWLECELGTTPDILPGPWGVYLEAVEGETYIGMITRRGGSWEALGQRLPEALEKDECYKMSMYLAHSKSYAGYNENIILRIWGGNERCDKAQLLGETKPIKNQDWKKFTFEFNTENDIKYLIIEAYYDKSKKYTHNGNLLIDGISAITFCNRV